MCDCWIEQSFVHSSTSKLHLFSFLASACVLDVKGSSHAYYNNCKKATLSVPCLNVGTKLLYGNGITRCSVIVV